MMEISQQARDAAKWCHDVTFDWGRQYPESCEQRIQTAIDEACRNAVKAAQAEIEQLRKACSIALQHVQREPATSIPDDKDCAVMDTLYNALNKIQEPEQ
jgi:predicted KAP-like P-loop ATPase